MGAFGAFPAWRHPFLPFRTGLALQGGALFQVHRSCNRIGEDTADPRARYRAGVLCAAAGTAEPLYEVFTIVRRHWVQTFCRLATPSTTIIRDCTFGLNNRFVRRLEKLTLRPNLVVLPQTSHLPATSRILPRPWSLDCTMLDSRRESGPRCGRPKLQTRTVLARPARLPYLRTTGFGRIVPGLDVFL
jgi:hypothetical protein